MNPQTIQALLQVPEFQEFLAFLQDKIKQLNSLDGLDGTTADEIALKLKARLDAVATLNGLLAPFLTPPTPITPQVDNKDFVM